MRGSQLAVLPPTREQPAQERTRTWDAHAHVVEMEMHGLRASKGSERSLLH